MTKLADLDKLRHLFTQVPSFSGYRTDEVTNVYVQINSSDILSLLDELREKTEALEDFEEFGTRHSAQHQPDGGVYALRLFQFIKWRSLAKLYQVSRRKRAVSRPRSPRKIQTTRSEGWCVVKEVFEGWPIEKSEFVFRRTAMAMEHNYLCSVCKEHSGVQDLYTGILQPCWFCQKNGYVLIKKKSWIPMWVYE